MRRRFVSLVLLFACGTPAPDLERDRAELLRLHEQARTAHLDTRADLMVVSFDDSLRSVARGRVTIASPEQNRSRLPLALPSTSQPLLSPSLRQPWQLNPRLGHLA